MNWLAAIAMFASADLRPLADAPLHAVQFVDLREGWTAGADGVVWHTVDGGKSWERQPTGTRATLRAVHFVTPYTGWAVGRDEQPAGQESAGVVLVTTDGGLKWTRLNDRALPGLQVVRFFDESTGIVAGDGSDLSPSGVFVTKDGGRSWHAAPGGRCPTWLAADFSDQQTGILAGAWGRLATLRDGVFNAADVEKLAGRNVQAVRVQGQRAAAVGQGGLVLLSKDSAGVRWGFADLKLPAEVAAQCDFRGLAMSGSHLWVVGRPGSVVFHSPDFGQHWEAQPTGQTLPLHAIQFFNESTGWAVGDFGTILGTTDGGRTWTVQRCGGQRAAALFIHATDSHVPLETVAVLGTDDGYLTASVRVSSADPASASLPLSTDNFRWCAAARKAGGAAADSLSTFPLAQHLNGVTRSEILDVWGGAVGGNASDALVRQLALQIRTWQPEVVVTDFAGAPLETIVVEAVRLACDRAADPNSFPEHRATFQLLPWAVKKLYTVWDGPGVAPVTIDAANLRQRLGDSPRDFATPAFRLLDSAANAILDKRSFRLLSARIPDAAKHSELMAGTALGYGGVARRVAPADDIDPERIEAAKKAAQERRNLAALSQSDWGRLTDSGALLAQIGPVLDKLPPDQGAMAAQRVAEGFVHAGQWALAREAYMLLAQRYPAHPASAEGYRWLVAFHASSEARRREELGQFVLHTTTDIKQASAVPTRDDPARFGPGSRGKEDRPLSEAVTEQSKRTISNPAVARKWYEGALAIESKLTAFGPRASADPAVQLCLQAARRQLGDVDGAKPWFRQYLASQRMPLTGPGSDPYRECAATELWLAERSGPAPRPVTACRRCDERPHLDGRLDDACWTGLAPMMLRDSSGTTQAAYPAKAWLAYDDEYLYFAVECKHPQDRYVAPVTKRTRDAELRGFDRVSVLLDLDRDFRTYYRLSVDQRGALAEDCWGDRNWNPKWYVAHASTPEGWTAEVAVPLAELTGDPVSLGKAWACNVVRVLPGRGVQAWSQPADAEPRPEGLGLMLFAEDPKPSRP